MQKASLRRYTLTDGRGKGLEIIDCDNGKLRFLLNVNKALDVMQLYHEGQNMSFLSKNAFSAKELPFERRFEGGMLYTCGLDSVGARDGFELHGNLHNTPAEVTRAECTEAGIVVEALLRDTALFGKNLLLRRKITSAVGGESVRIEDALINEGFRAEPYCLLYHINVGYPMLDEGAELTANVTKREPRTSWAAKNAATMYEMTAPIPDQAEMCYFLTLGNPTISLNNKKIGKTLTVSYSSETLPHFVEWKSMASGDYALGLEPSTTELDDRFAYRKIRAGETVYFWVELCVSRLFREGK